jgi:TetR/AcrR family transcriptional regulator, transcriptional repressor of bet genes
MPKRVDQRARRRQIVDAVWRVTVDRGLESVSLRQVAAEVGGSVGLLQHYFKDKNEMLLFALDILTDQVSGRMARGIAAMADSDAPQKLVRAMLIELLPLDQERAVEARVACAFLARAAVDPNVSAHYQSGRARGQEFLVTQLRRGGAEHPTQEANTLLALVDGLTLHTLAGHHLPEGALAALDAELDRLWGGNASTGSRDDNVRHLAVRKARTTAAQPVSGGHRG